MTQFVAMVLALLMLMGNASVAPRTAEIQEAAKEVITMCSDEETKQNTDVSIISVSEAPGKNGLTTMRISGRGTDFANLNFTISYSFGEDASYLEANFSLMEPGGEFDLFWLDMTADTTDDGVAVSGLMQAMTNIEMNINYEGVLADGVLTVEAVADIDGDELEPVAMTAQRVDGEVVVSCDGELPEGEEFEVVNVMLQNLPETLMALLGA